MKNPRVMITLKYVVSVSGSRSYQAVQRYTTDDIRRLEIQLKSFCAYLNSQYNDRIADFISMRSPSRVYIPYDKRRWNTVVTFKREIEQHYREWSALIQNREILSWLDEEDRT